jgi:hypothetical protein
MNQWNQINKPNFLLNLIFGTNLVNNLNNNNIEVEQILALLYSQCPIVVSHLYLNLVV